jgi:hypothetical protein
MVHNSGATPANNSFRPLNLPIPIDVKESGHQTPRAIKIKGRWRRVVSIDEVWSIDEEWWRQKPIVKMADKLLCSGTC